MSKKRMSWDMVRGQRVFVFTKFLNHNIFEVEVMRGNDVTPQSKPWFEYTEVGTASKDAVANIAFSKARTKILEEENETP